VRQRHRGGQRDDAPHSRPGDDEELPAFRDRHVLPQDPAANEVGEPRTGKTQVKRSTITSALNATPAVTIRPSPASRMPPTTTGSCSLISTKTSPFSTNVSASQTA